MSYSLRFSPSGIEDVAVAAHQPQVSRSPPPTGWGGGAPEPRLLRPHLARDLQSASVSTADLLVGL